MASGTRVIRVGNPHMIVRTVIDPDDKILEAAPVVSKFVGTDIRRLIGWMSCYGQEEVQVHELLPNGTFEEVVFRSQRPPQPQPPYRRNNAPAQKKGPHNHDKPSSR